ncbi:MAG: integrase, partial [Thermoproteota archaeon]
QPRNGYGTDIGSGTVPFDRESFEKFVIIDMACSRKTAKGYSTCLRLFLSKYDFIMDNIRDFLLGIENPNTYNNYVKAFKAYARFLGGELCLKQKPKWDPIRFLPNKKELQEFYLALDTQYERLAFIGYAVTGLRRHELLDLKMDQINLQMRAIIPKSNSLTKRTWITFYNEELEEELSIWLKLRKKSDRLFPIRGSHKSVLFRIAHHKTGLHITPQTLRFWFANEMARLGVPDRFIDAFQGRIPRSVLARHYTDYSLENLKTIYDRAGLKVLS